MDEIKMWAIDGTQATPVPVAKMMESEGLLEEILVNNPDMLMPDLTLVGRQTHTEGGPLDLLGVDGDGRLVLFELKRETLSRAAVAQIIDYASDLEARGVYGLAAYIAERSGSGGIDKIEDFTDLHAEKVGPDNLDALLPLRMFLVGLGVDDRTERMVNFLANKGVDISLLTFHGFEQAGGKMALARLTQVMADDDSVYSRPQPRKRPTQDELRERLYKRAEENNLVDVFNEAQEMFREKSNHHIEHYGDMGTSMRLHLPSKSSPEPYARVNPTDRNGGQVQIIFYSHGVELCREEISLLQKEIRHETSTPDLQNTLQLSEMRFLVNAKEWEIHKDKLSALTQAVHDALQKSNESDQNSL